MQRIGILNDIHSNLPALEAALRYLEEQHCDAIYCTGDLLAIGPYPAECLDRVMGLPHFFCVRGNHESYYLQGLEQGFPPEEAEHQAWIHARLSPRHREYLRSLPMALHPCLSGNALAFTHYPFHADGSLFPIVKNPTSKELEHLFEGESADIIFYGHEHAFSHVETPRRRYVNCGALGCPHDGSNLARGGILTLESQPAHLDFFALPYAVEQVFLRMEETRMPQRDFIKAVFFGRSQG